MPSPRIAGLAALAALALGALPATPAPSRAAAGPSDTVFVWTIEPYRLDLRERTFGCGVYDTRRGRAMVVAGGVYSSHTGGYSQHPQSFVALARGPADSVWSSIAPPGPAVDEACAAYDSAGDAVWLFGGLHYDNIYPSSWTTRVMSDLWRLDVANASWTIVPPVGLHPRARMGASLVLDPARGRLWLFGGLDSLGAPLDDLWRMDLATPGSWSQVVPGPGPPVPWPAPRARHLAVRDPVGDRMLVIAGVGAAGPLADTWELPFSGGWQGLATTGTPPAGRLVGAFDAARGRVLAGGSGDGAIYALDQATAEWSAHRPSGEGQITPESAVILDPVRDALISAWSGIVTSAFSPYTAPTAFLHLAGPLEPTVHLSATLTAASYWHGATELIWDMQFDHPLWNPAVLESTSLAGSTGEIRTVMPSGPGPTSLGIYDASLAGDTVQVRMRWFDGSAWQVTPGAGLRFPPAPLVLHITPDSLFRTGDQLNVWFHVAEDSATYLAAQSLERRDNGGLWNLRHRWYPEANRIWSFVDDQVVTFSRYEYRLTWVGPDGITRASPSFGTTILGPPTLIDTAVQSYSVTLRWSTGPGVDEVGRVLVRRSAAHSGVPGPPWDDTLAVQTDASGVLAITDTQVSPNLDIVYRLEWFDRQDWWATSDVGVHTPYGGVPAISFSLGRAEPNPASDAFDLPVEVTGPWPATIDLYDLAGRKRWSGSAAPGATNVHVDATGLETGIYLVRGSLSALVRKSRVAIVR